jgi:nicotinamidase-related amidase
MTDDFLNDTGAFEGCKMPDPDKVIAQLRRLADKLEAKRTKWAAAGRLHPAERWRGK